jgi:ADP-heptose:LPS heptosyltransferase
MSDIWLDCARFLGVEPQGLQPEVFLTDEEKKWARNSRHEIFGKTPLVLVHPGCGGNTCNLPPSDYGHLLERLLKETGAGVAVTGSEKEKELTAGWPESLSQNSRFYNAMGRWSLRQFMAMIHESDLLVCVGTGPLHLASALGKRTLSPFCPLVGVSPQVWGNLGGEAHVLCGQLAHCQKEEGPRAMHCDFRGEVTVDALVASVQRLLPR